MSAILLSERKLFDSYQARHSIMAATSEERENAKGDAKKKDKDSDSEGDDAEEVGS